MSHEPAVATNPGGGPTDAPPPDKPKLVCLGCGYDLSGLAQDASCPECAIPLARTRRGDTLELSSTAYLSRVHVGCRLAQAAAIGFALTDAAFYLALATLGTSRSTIDSVSRAAFLFAPLCSLASVVGWWRITAPDESQVGPDRAPRLRWAVRAAVLVDAVLWSAYWAIAWNAWNTRPTLQTRLTLQVVTVPVVIAWWYTTFQYGAWLRSRAPGAPPLRRGWLPSAPTLIQLLTALVFIPVLLVAVAFGGSSTSLAYLVTGLGLFTHIRALSLTRAAVTAELNHPARVLSALMARASPTPDGEPDSSTSAT